METYPIMIDGELAGKLNVETKGARTAFDAECRPRPDLVRISVYGGGREGYLGVLAPENGRLTLHKTLSREQLRGFPREIESVERAGRDAASPAETEGRGTAHAEDTEPEPEAGAPAPPDPAALSWYASPDGALVCFDGEQSLIALPLGDTRIPEGVAGEQRTIEGREYLVYRAKDGKIVR